MKSPESTTAQVLEAARELHALGSDVTRSNLRELTGLKMTVIDDRLKHLYSIGSIARLRPGHYAPVQEWPEPRAISRTVLPSGLVKIEVGDVVLDLTPAEDRQLGAMQMGAAVQLTILASKG